MTDVDVTAARSYRPGSWFGIFGDTVLVCLPPSEKARVGTLWELVDAGATFDEVLDALISSGLRDLPGFVLVSQVDDTKIVIRGQAYASLVAAGEKIQVDAPAGATWVERTISGCLRHGGVRRRRGRGSLAADQLRPGPDRGSRDAGRLVGPGGRVPCRRAGAAGHRRRRASSSPVPDLPEDDETADQPAVEHDGQTVFGDPEPDPEPAGITGQPQAPAVTSRPVATLVFSNGETVGVDRAILVGRSPEARRFASGDQPRLVSVPSPHQEISSTHLEIRPGSGADHGSAVVTDLGSTNGSVLVQPGLPPEDLTPGVAVQLIPGAIVDLGDGVTIQVINP